MYLIVALILTVTNLVAFILMGVDKSKARRHVWRIPEKTLFLASGLFGALGGTLGMFVFHHKTKHWYFRWGFPVMLAVQIVILFFAAGMLK